MKDSAKAISAKRKSLRFRFSNTWDLYFFLIPTLVYFAIFHYAPMYGLQIAFKTFKIRQGIWGSPWADPWFYQFERLFSTSLLQTALLNTLALSAYSLLFGFLPPIILALMLNQVTNLRFKKFVQTVSYAPHFISVVVMVSMLFCMFSTTNGIVTRLLGLLGIGPYPITSTSRPWPASARSFTRPPSSTAPTRRSASGMWIFPASCPPLPSCSSCAAAPS